MQTLQLRVVQQLKCHSSLSNRIKIPAKAFGVDRNGIIDHLPGEIIHVRAKAGELEIDIIEEEVLVDIDVGDTGEC